MNKIEKYKDTAITFAVKEGSKNLMVNATEMAKPFGHGKEPSYLLNTKQSQEIIKTFPYQEILKRLI